MEWGSARRACTTQTGQRRIYTRPQHNAGCVHVCVSRPIRSVPSSAWQQLATPAVGLAPFCSEHSRRLDGHGLSHPTNRSMDHLKAQTRP